MANTSAKSATQLSRPSNYQLTTDLIVCSRFHLYNCWLATFCGVWATLLAGAKRISDESERIPVGQTKPISVELVLSQAVRVLASSYIFCGAGMVWNDLIDSKIDREVSRTKNRPIAAGRVTAKQALAWIMVQFLVSWYLVHCTLGGQKVLPVMVPVTLSTLLYPFGKREFFRRCYIYPQYFLAFTLAYPSVIGQLAITGEYQSFSEALLQSLPLAISTAAWTIYFNTAYSYQDIEGDKKMKVNSFYLLAGSHIHSFLVVLAGLALGAISFLLWTQESLWLWGSWMCVWAQSLASQLMRFDAKKPDSGGPIHKENFALGVWTMVACTIELVIRVRSAA